MPCRPGLRSGSPSPASPARSAVEAGAPCSWECGLRPVPALDAGPQCCERSPGEQAAPQPKGEGGAAAFGRAPLAGLSASVLAFSSLAEPMCPADGAPGWRSWALVEALPVQRGWPTTNGAHGHGLRARHGHPHHLVLPTPPGCPCPALATGRSLVPPWPLPARLSAGRPHTFFLFLFPKHPQIAGDDFHGVE